MTRPWTEGGESGMTRRGPLVTLGAVLVLAVIFLWANTLVPKPASTAAAVPAPWTSAGAASQALYAGRSSGDQVTVAIAVTGSKAAAELNAGLAGQVSLQGSANGSQVTLTTRSGTGLDGSAVRPGHVRHHHGVLRAEFPVLRRAGRHERRVCRPEQRRPGDFGGRHRRRYGRGLRVQRPDRRGLAAGLGIRQPGQPDRARWRGPGRLPVRPDADRHDHARHRPELPLLS